MNLSVSYQCGHLSPLPLSDNNFVRTGMRSIWRDGCGVIFPFPVTLECYIHQFVCLSVCLSIYLAFSPTPGALFLCRVQILCYDFLWFSESRSYSIWAALWRHKLLSEAVTTDSNREWHHDRGSKGTSVVRGGKKKTAETEEKICFMEEKQTLTWQILAFLFL